MQNKYQIREHRELTSNHVLNITYHVYKLTPKVKMIKKWPETHVVGSRTYEPMTYLDSYRTMKGRNNMPWHIPIKKYYEFDSIQKAKQFIHDYELAQRNDVIVEEIQ